MNQIFRKLTLLFLCGSLLTGCQQNRPAPVDARNLDPLADGAFCAYQNGDPAQGRELFERQVLADRGGCITCHSLEPDVTLVGPSLYGIAATAAERQPGVIPANYLYLSIVDPNQYVVDGFLPDLMPDTYASELSEEEITNFVSFLMTLTPDN